MKLLRKIIIVLFAIVLVLTTTPIALAEFPSVVDGGTSGNLSWTLDNTNTLEISGTGNMGMYSTASYSGIYASNAPWGKYYSRIESVVIGNGVTSIGSYAFARCTALTSIDFGNSVTTIGVGAFEYCESLTDISIPDSVTIINRIAFMACDALTSVTIGNGVTEIGTQAFSYCTSLSSVSFGDSLNHIGGYAFESCRSLTNIIIPNSVTEIDIGAFRACTSLENISVNEGNLYYEADDSGCLYTKDKTTLVQYPVGNSRSSFTIPTSVIEIDYYSFLNCNSLTNIEIGNNVTRIYTNAFSGCRLLTSVAFGEKIQQIGNGAFSACSSLASVDLPASVKTIDSQAFPDNALKDFTIRSRKCSIADNAISLDATIHGYTGSSAEEFANTYGYSFVFLGPLPPCEHQVENWAWTSGDVCIGGTQTGICILCDETITETVAASGHKYKVIGSLEPDCVKNGYTRYHCEICGDVYTEQREALGHNYIDTVVEPTCTKQGYAEKKCSRCGETDYFYNIPMIDHDYQLDKVIEPTCTSEGQIIYICTSCGDRCVEQQAKLAHSFGNWRTFRPAETEESSIQIRTCSVCGAYELRIYDPEGTTSGYPVHVHHFVVTEKLDATCESDGYEIGFCICGEKKTEIIKSLGHDINENGDCTRCGKHIKDVTPPNQPVDEKPKEENLNFFQQFFKAVRDFFAKLFGRR